MYLVVASFHSFYKGDEANERNPHSKQPAFGPTIETSAYRINHIHHFHYCTYIYLHLSHSQNTVINCDADDVGLFGGSTL
jgi:hypothetical protein